MDARHVLDDVPKITGYEHVDFYTDAVSIALCYGNDELRGRFPMGVFDALSGFSGRGWLIGFNEASYYWERHGMVDPDPSFAVSGLEAYLRHYDTMVDVLRYVDRVPEFLWHEGCDHSVDPDQAAGLIGICQKVDAVAVREYVAGHLQADERPVVALLHLPGADIVDIALLAGYESRGEVVLGRSFHQGPGTDNSGGSGYFRLPDWEREVLAVFGIGPEQKTEWPKDPCFIAIENALKCAKSYAEGTKHYGLAAYDAWERALLDDTCIDGADDEAVARRLQYHSCVAGSTACQKAFTALPECHAPSMGVVDGLVRRAGAGTGLIHGLMWDAWQAVGGYWRRSTDEGRLRWEGTEELARFRDPRVRERAAKVIRRARKIDSESVRDLEEARDDWRGCIGHGTAHPCPCWGLNVCARV